MNFYAQDKITGEGVHTITIHDHKTHAVKAVYTIIDYSDDTGCMYVIQRTENPNKSAWTESLPRAINLCIADYKSRAC